MKTGNEKECDECTIEYNLSTDHQSCDAKVSHC